MTWFWLSVEPLVRVALDVYSGTTVIRAGCSAVSEGCVSSWGQVFGDSPSVVEATAEDGGTNGEQVLGALT